jgi:hypothetical protein
MSDFLARWSKRKTALREGAAVPELPPAEPVAAEPALRQAQGDRDSVQAELVEAPAPAAEPPPPPTLDDVAQLTRQSDFRRFVAPDVDPGVKNAALKKLFTDPHFNVMDGLDTYIDDYGKPDPIPASMLRSMVQSAALGLFQDEQDKAPATPDDDQDPAVRLQPDDAPGPPGLAGGADEDPGRER